MSAGVHDADLDAGRIAHLDFGGIGQAGELGDGEGVQVGPKHDRRALTVLQHADDAGATDTLCHFHANSFELLGHPSSRFLFLEGELGMGVEVLVELKQLLDIRGRPFARGFCVSRDR